MPGVPAKPKGEIMSVSQAFAVIESLDLEPIKMKLMHDSGKGWDAKQAEATEMDYRRFLYLMKKYPDEQLAPLEHVDIFWHYHILDTQKYAADCNLLFGYFLHHFPYSGMRGEEDELANQRMGDRMATLYEQTFGESYIRNEHAAVAYEDPSNLSTHAANTLSWARTAKPGATFCTQATTAFCTQSKPAFCTQAKPAFCTQTAPLENPDFSSARSTFTR
jgi:hypothetical protein